MANADIFVGIPSGPFVDAQWGETLHSAEDFRGGSEIVFQLRTKDGRDLRVSYTPEHRSQAQKLLDAAKTGKVVKFKGHLTEAGDMSDFHSLDTSWMLHAKKRREEEEPEEESASGKGSDWEYSTIHQAANSLFPKLKKELSSMARWIREKEQSGEIDEEEGYLLEIKDWQRRLKTLGPDAEDTDYWEIESELDALKNSIEGLYGIKIGSKHEAAVDPEDTSQEKQLKAMLSAAKKLLKDLKKDGRIKGVAAESFESRLELAEEAVMGVKDSSTNWPYEDARAYLKSLLHLLKQRTYGTVGAGKDKAATPSITLPPVDSERYPEIPGLEGPFRYPNGDVLYYDPKEGKYYDNQSDIYVDQARVNNAVFGSTHPVSAFLTAFPVLKAKIRVLSNLLHTKKQASSKARWVILSYAQNLLDNSSPKNLEDLARVAHLMATLEQQ